MPVIKSYKEAEDFLYKHLPMFQRIGGAAYKENLDNIQKLSAFLGNPEKKFQSVHVAGTNGKGSTCHFLASILQEAGYKTGLFTSPHLKSFRERIKINGVLIEENEVIDFVNICETKLKKLQPSFFEMATALAFHYFAKKKVVIAIIETGMGGRLDSTNIITPLLSVITSISLDHTEFLGNTLEKISVEKAGIIKKNVPVVISIKQNETNKIFIDMAYTKSASIYFAEDIFTVIPIKNHYGSVNKFKVESNHNPKNYFIKTPVNGIYQKNNIPGILQSVKLLNGKGFRVSEKNIKKGFLKVQENTSLQGRWQKIGEKPLIMCDVAHNEDGLKLVCEQISNMKYRKLIIIFGMVKEKDSYRILSQFPQKAEYIFCEADIPRAKPANELAKEAEVIRMKGIVIKKPIEALAYAKEKACKNDFILVTGSTFVVGEIL